MDNELELKFKDEAEVYLPQVVADENKRRANERERAESELKRQEDELERQAKEQERIEAEAKRQEDTAQAIADMTERFEELKVDEGLGVPMGGKLGQVLAKKSDTDNDTEWVDQTPPFSGDYNDLTNTPKIPTNVSELTNDTGYAVKSEVNESITQLTTSLNGVASVQSQTSTAVAQKTVYSDLTIEIHTVNWNGGQIYTGHKRTDSSNTITKSGYYPIGVVDVTANSSTRNYHLRGQSGKGNGTITVTYSYYSDGNETTAAGDMPSAIVLVAWARIR